MNDAIEAIYSVVKSELTDMYGHMDTLRSYASQCKRIAEFGVWDCTSTWALLAGRPEKLTSYDIVRKPEVDLVEKTAAECHAAFEFVLSSSLDVDIGIVDLLFIDSLHTYDHLSKELEKHSGCVSKFIILHDTETFGHVDETYSGKGLWPAIEEFLTANPQWRVHEKYTHCHGLTVLARQ